MDQDHDRVIMKVLQRTQLRAILFEILERPQIDMSEKDLARYFKLEAAWILTNLAFGNEDEIGLLITGTLEIVKPEDRSKAEASSKAFFHLVRTLLEREAHDPQMID